MYFHSIIMKMVIISFLFIIHQLQKCLDKDPARRWTCERLMGHPLFLDYLAKHKDDLLEQTESHKSNRSRDKSKVRKNSAAQVDIFQFSFVNFSRIHRCR